MTIYSPYVNTVALKLPIKNAVPENLPDYNKISYEDPFGMLSTQMKTRLLCSWPDCNSLLTAYRSLFHSSEKVLLRQFKALLPHLSLTPSVEDDRHMHKFSPTHQYPKLGLYRAANDPKQLTYPRFSQCPSQSRTDLSQKTSFVHLQIQP